MAIERVRAQKMETTVHGGSRVDQVTSEVDPQSEFYDALGYALQRTGTDDGTVYVSRSTDDQLQFTDAVNGTVKLAQMLASNQALTAVTGDVTATGPGSAAATVAKVGGSLAADINQVIAALKGAFAQNLVVAAPAGASGALAPRALVAADIPTLPATQISGLAPSATVDTTNAANIASGTLNASCLSGAYAGITGVGALTAGTVPVSLLGTAGAAPGQVPVYGGSAVAWTTPTAYLAALTGDVTASGTGSQAATVAKVGGSLAADVNQVVAALKGAFAQNLVVAAPSGSAGALAPRALVAADIPTLPASQISGLAASATTDATNAANIASGILPPARLSGPYAGITGVGTLISGAVPVSLLTSSATNGYVLTVSNGTVVAAAATGGGSATGSVPNAINTLPQRDGTGAIYTSPPVQIFSGAGNSHTTSIDESGTVYYLDGGGTANALTLTLNTLPAAQAGAAGACNTSAAGSTYTIRPASGGRLFYALNSTASTLTSVVPQSTINFVGRPGSANWVVQNVSGVWQDAANGVALGGGFVADASYTGKAMAASAAGALVLRDANGNFAANTITAALNGAATSFSGALAGDVSGTQAATVVNQVGGQAASAVAAATTLVSGSQTANFVLAAPSGSAGPLAPRALVAADIPTLPAAQISGLAASATTDATNATNLTSGILPGARLSGGYTGITAVGTLTAGSVPASLVTGLAASATTDATNAANIASGTLPPARLLGGYTGITAIGTLTAGSVPASLVTGLAASATTDATNAANIASGILPPARLSGPYTGITGLGTLVAGAVPITLLTTNATNGYVLTVNNGAVVAAAASSGGSPAFTVSAASGTSASPTTASTTTNTKYTNSTATQAYMLLPAPTTGARIAFQAESTGTISVFPSSGVKINVGNTPTAAGTGATSGPYLQIGTNAQAGMACIILAPNSNNTAWVAESDAGLWVVGP